MFTGFTQETSDFLWDLMFHNERPWFEENRERYRQVLGLPFSALAQETFDQFLAAAPEGDWTLHVSRIYRDSRRLYGRGPYKDNLWFSIQEGKDWTGVPSFWFYLSAEEYGRGIGLWDVNAARMQAYRRRIEADPDRFGEMVREMTADGRFVPDGERYRRPKGNMGPLLDPWYNQKRPGAEYIRPFGGEALDAALPGLLAGDFRLLWPYYEFLRGLTAL